MQYGLIQLQSLLANISDTTVRRIKSENDLCKQLNDNFDNINLLFSWIDTSIKDKKSNKDNKLVALNRIYNSIFGLNECARTVDNFDKNGCAYINSIKSIAFLCATPQGNAVNIDIVEKIHEVKFENISEFFRVTLLGLFSSYQLKGNNKQRTYQKLHQQIFEFTLLSAFYKSTCITDESYNKDLNLYVSPENANDDFFNKMYSLEYNKTLRNFIKIEGNSVLKNLHAKREDLNFLIKKINALRKKNKLHEIYLEKQKSTNEFYSHPQNTEADQLIIEWMNVFISTRKIDGLRNEIARDKPKYGSMFPSGHSAKGNASRKVTLDNLFGNGVSTVSCDFHQNFLKDTYFSLIRLLSLHNVTIYRKIKLSINGTTFIGGSPDENEIDRLHNLFVVKISNSIHGLIKQKT